jgi:hypothetical protein
MNVVAGAASGWAPVTGQTTAKNHVNNERYLTKSSHVISVDLCTTLNCYAATWSRRDGSEKLSEIQMKLSYASYFMVCAVLFRFINWVFRTCEWVYSGSRFVCSFSYNVFITPLAFERHTECVLSLSFISLSVMPRAVKCDWYKRVCISSHHTTRWVAADEVRNCAATADNLNTWCLGWDDLLFRRNTLYAQGARYKMRRL